MQKHWKSLIVPEEILVSRVSGSPNEAKIEIFPLERGYGLTLGAALRRVLLSSMRGSAVTSFKIQGVAHEFSAVSFLREDVTKIVLNLKKLLVRSVHDAPKVLTLSKKGRGLVYAGDIAKTPDVEILNPDLVLCEIVRDDVPLEIEMVVEQGSGYVQASSFSNREAGSIYMDALFSPILNVAMHVEKTRVKQHTDYDKLELVVRTDGSVQPRDAVAYAARILQAQLAPLINFTEPEEEVEEEVASEEETVLMQRIVDLPVSKRSANCLRNENIVYLRDLVGLSESDMMKMPNFGRKSLSELRALLDQYNLKFGMNVETTTERKK